MKFNIIICKSKRMAPKQIVFASQGSCPAFGMFDYVMIAVLIGLVAVSIYYITVTSRAVKKLENFAESNERVNRLVSNKLVYLYMKGCPYCVKFDKTFKEASELKKPTAEHPWAGNVAFKKMAIDSNEAVEYKKYKCDGFPCYMLFDSEGEKLIAKDTGYRPLAELSAWIQGAL